MSIGNFVWGIETEVKRPKKILEKENSSYLKGYTTVV